MVELTARERHSLRRLKVPVWWQWPTRSIRSVRESEYRNGDTSRPDKYGRVRLKASVVGQFESMMNFRMAESSILMSLKYDGEAVRKGAMPIDDVVLALQGFAGAYGKVASSVLPDSSHEIRVSGFKSGSFDTHIIGWITSQEGQQALKALGLVSTAAGSIFALVKSVIELKKHIKARPYQINIEGSSNTVLIINSEGNAQTTTADSLKILQAKLIDADLAKIAMPLQEGFIDDTTISAVEGEESATIITFADRASFVPQGTGETFQDVSLLGKLISNNSEHRTGRFATRAGDRIPYHYIGASPELFLSTYGASGTVRVSGRAFFDENLRLTRIDITDAVKSQHRIWPLRQKTH